MVSTSSMLGPIQNELPGVPSVVVPATGTVAVPAATTGWLAEIVGTLKFSHTVDAPVFRKRAIVGWFDGRFRLPEPTRMIGTLLLVRVTPFVVRMNELPIGWNGERIMGYSVSLGLMTCLRLISSLNVSLCPCPVTPFSVSVPPKCEFFMCGRK